MNIILLFDKDFVSQSTVRLEDRRHHHILSILKATKGSILKVGMLNGERGVAEAISITQKDIMLDVTLNQPPPPPLPLNLILAFPRPKILRRVIQCCSSMGVKNIALIRTWKVEKSYLQSPYAQKDNLFEDMILGLEQAGDTILPEIKIFPLFKPFIEDCLDAFSTDSQRIVAHPHAALECPVGVNKPLTLAIGPEAGFIPYEIAQFEKKNFSVVSIGERILRVDQAVPALIGRLITGSHSGG